MSDISIRELIKKGVVEQAIEENVQPCSLDVRLNLDSKAKAFKLKDWGGWIYLCKDGIKSDEEEMFFEVPIHKELQMMIDPGEHLLVSTIEKVNCPNDIAIRVEGKSSLGRIFLAVHVTAGFVDPGFSGNITLELVNLGTVPIYLEHGAKIAQLCFFQLDSPVESIYGTRNNNYQNSEGTILPKIHYLQSK